MSEIVYIWNDLTSTPLGRVVIAYTILPFALLAVLVVELIVTAVRERNKR